MKLDLINIKDFLTPVLLNLSLQSVIQNNLYFIEKLKNIKWNEVFENLLKISFIDFSQIEFVKCFAECKCTNVV